MAMRPDIIRIRHCMKRIAHMLNLVVEEMDDLCDAIGIIEETRENKNLDKEVDAVGGENGACQRGEEKT
ncbi:hypothetical protein LCGC14_1088200 [marine sediment metagenome]|uniref:Uncharacterized protein n=1 Tax=marine sediment metagenome TaxID=412755 RepID=A0A0F9PWE4_9ZZZZ